MTSDNQLVVGLPSARVKLTASADDTADRSVATARTTGHRRPYRGRARAGRSLPAPVESSSRSLGGFIRCCRFHRAECCGLDVAQPTFVLCDAGFFGGCMSL